MQAGKLILWTIAYFALFTTFEYMNAVNMTSGSWRSIVVYALKPWVFLFFALCPILIWGINKEIFESMGARFWFTGIFISFIEFASYLVGSWIFYRKSPTLREGAGLCLMALALVVAYDHKSPKN